MLRQKVGFWLGPLLFALIYFIPAGGGLSLSAKSAAAVCLWMAVWWVTEAAPLAATSLIPLALYPLMGILSMEDTARRYADPNIFLFMGGFMLALAMQKCGLHKRIALMVIYIIGGGRRRMLGGFLAATALISMWVSNTATCLMMLPIGLAVISKMSSSGQGGLKGFDTSLMLAIAYASSIGGIATLIGSPPNMILAGQMKELFPGLPEIGFFDWFMFAAPLAVGFLAITWAYFCLTMPAEKSPSAGDRSLIQQELLALGKASSAEVRVVILFILTVAGWVFRAHIPGAHDATISMIAAILLFTIPSGTPEKGFLLDWEQAKKLPWEVLLLFGGGFALAESFQVTGLAAWIASAFTGLEGVPIFWLILCVCLVTTFMSELMSNTAQVMLLLPILASLSASLAIHPLYLMMPAALASSLAFMMPVGTPPNAIVFGSGHVTIPQMAKAGLVLNLLGALWLSAYSTAFLKYFIS